MKTQHLKRFLRTIRTACLLAGAAWAASLPVAEHLSAADGIPVQDAPPSGAEGTKYFYQQAQAYEIHRGDESKALELVESPLLNWTNPARTNEQGILVLWLQQGRPEALATMFTYQIGEKVYEKHELLSLSSLPLSAKFRNRLAWAPTQPGFQQVDLGDVAAPAGVPRLREIQMKRIARDFTGTITQRSGESTVLRQLPTPLYRYEKTDGDLIDGAIFSLNVGTDPEVLILIEARNVGGTPVWQSSFARLHYDELKVERDGQQIWSAKPAYELMNDLTGKQEYLSAPYFTYYPQTLLQSP